MKIVGLLGNAGSGKDTVGNMIVSLVKGARTIALADPLKEFCKQVYNFTDEQLWGPSAKRNEPDKRYVRLKAGELGWIDKGVDDEGNVIWVPNPREDVYLTPRYALQTLGTEWGRNCYANTWIDMGIRRASRMLKVYDDYVQSFGLFDTEEPRASLVVITDCRFINEAEAIRAAGGAVWRITRPNINAATTAAAGIAGHASESEQNSSEIDQYITATIHNDGSLDDLRHTVRGLLQL